MEISKKDGKIIITIEHTTQDDECTTHVCCKGRATPVQFDRACLSIISGLLETRQEEMSKTGSIKLTSLTGKNFDKEKFKEYQMK